MCRLHRIASSNLRVISMQCCNDAEVRTTRSRAQEETYSSSSEEDDEAGSDLEGSELESSPASSVKDPSLQV